MTTPTPTAPMTVSEFARWIGCKPAYVHQLKNEGRLVLADDGKKIIPEASKTRIADTRDPSKAGVAQRHAAERGTPIDTGHVPITDDDDTPTDGAATGGGEYVYQNAKAKREHYAALREETLYRKEAGALVEREAVAALFADVGTAFRARLEGWCNSLPPQCVGRDESAIRALMSDQAERLLTDISAQFKSWSDGHE